MASSLQQGINAAKAGRMTEALDYLKDALIEEPQNADVWVWIAAIIDDLDKQEIFLEKALAIDPNNIPAQRGMAYLQKRKHNKVNAQYDHLSEHTKPISPFPNSKRPKQPVTVTGWAKLGENELDAVGRPQTEQMTTGETGGIFNDLPRLSIIEIALLAIVVIVFCFIGLLAASAIFEFELPLEFLIGDRPRLTMQPPYPGVFLYEDETFLNLQKYEGIPDNDHGIPTSTKATPVIVLWGAEAAPEQVHMFYETGEYIPLQRYQVAGDGNLIQPDRVLEPGLYCLQQILTDQESQPPLYWCFKVSNP